MNFIKGMIIALTMAFISNTYASSTECIRRITDDFRYSTTFTNVDLSQLELRDYGKDYLAQSHCGNQSLY